MSLEGSITAWLGELKAGKESAAQKLWERYVTRLVGLARSRLGRTPQAAGDEEDVVQAAFKSFFAGVQNGRFPQLNDRDDLWRLLVVLTERRAIDHIRRECRRATAGPEDRKVNRTWIPVAFVKASRSFFAFSSSTLE